MPTFPYPNQRYTSHLGLSLFGMDEVLADNMNLIDAAYGSGSSINVNGTLVTSPNLNGVLPVAPAGKANVIWQFDINGNVSAYYTPGGGGSTVDINGAPVASPNFNDTTPAASAGYTNIAWQVDVAGNISAQLLLAATKAAVSSKWINSYDATTGLFTETQPAASDLSVAALANGITATTQTTSDTTTKLATDAFVHAAITAGVPSGNSEMVGVSASGGSLSALPGSILDYVNGTVAIAPSGAGASVSALDVTGDSIGNGIQEWFVYGSSASGMITSAYGDTQGVVEVFYDAGGFNITEIFPGVIGVYMGAPNSLIGASLGGTVAVGLYINTQNAASTGSAGLPYPTKGLVESVVATGEPTGQNATGIELFVGGHANLAVFGLYSRVCPWESVGPNSGYSVFIDTPKQDTTGGGGGVIINNYGLYIADQINPYSTVLSTAIYVAGGNSIFNDPIVLSGGLAQTVRTVTGACYATAKDSTINANGTFTIYLNPTTMALTSVAPVTGTFALTGVTTTLNGSATYTGTITGGASNAFAGHAYQISGFGNTGNNGVFICTASTATTLVLTNAAAVVETQAASAVTYCAIYQGTITGGASNAYAGAIFAIAGFTHGGNNTSSALQYRCSASTATSLTLVNASAVTESHAATATPRITVGQKLRIVNIGSGTVTLSSTVNINGANTLTNSVQYSVNNLQWDGSQWWASSEQSSFGTVTSFSAGALSPLFTTSVATATTTPALSFSLSNAGGGTVFGNNTTGAAAPGYTIAPVLGIPGTSTGTIALASSTASGLYTITAPANAATPTITLPTSSGVLVDKADGTVFTATIAATGTLALANAAAGTVLGNPTGSAAAPSYTATPVLGLNASVSGTLGLANGGGSGTTITLQNLGNTTAYNFNLPIAAGAAGSVLTSQAGGSTSMTWTTQAALAVAWSSLTAASGALTLANGANATTFQQTSAVTWTLANTTPTVTGAATTVALSTSTVPTNPVGNSWVYTLAATESGAGSNGWAGAIVTLSGYTGGGSNNNGASLPITASTTTTVTITNPNGVGSNGGTPVMISTAVVDSPIHTLSATINSGVAGTLNSIADSWSLQVVIGSVVPNPTSTLAITHAGTTGTTCIALPSTTGISWNNDVFVSRSSGHLVVGQSVGSNTGITTQCGSFLATQGAIGSSSYGVGVIGCGMTLDPAGTLDVLAFTNYAGSAVFGVGGAATGTGLSTVWASGVVAAWSSTVTLHGALDTGISRINGGIIGVGTGAAGSIAGSIQASSIALNGAVASPTAGVYYSGTSAGVTQTAIAVGTLATTGGIVTTFTGVSDERLKDSKTYDGGLEEILGITPIRFTYNDLGQKFGGWDKDHVYVGFSAQNVQKSIPEAIQGTEGPEEYLSFDDRPVIAALVNAVKELSAKNDALENRLARLEALLNV